jgi:hypothetical protein
MLMFRLITILRESAVFSTDSTPVEFHAAFNSLALQQ